jgi:hypothetical protein
MAKSKSYKGWNTNVLREDFLVVLSVLDFPASACFACYSGDRKAYPGKDTSVAGASASVES